MPGTSTPRCCCGLKCPRKERIVTIRAFRGHYSPQEHRGVEVPGIYWHFVDIMWLVVYTTVYIL